MRLPGREDLETGSQNKLPVFEYTLLVTCRRPDLRVEVFQGEAGGAHAGNTPGPSELLVLIELTRTVAMGAPTEGGAYAEANATPRISHQDRRAAGPLRGFVILEFRGVKAECQIPLQFPFMGTPQKIKLVNFQGIGVACVACVTCVGFFAVIDQKFWAAGGHAQENCDGEWRNHCPLIVAAGPLDLENGV